MYRRPRYSSFTRASADLHFSIFKLRFAAPATDTKEPKVKKKKKNRSKEWINFFGYLSSSSSLSWMRIKWKENLTTDSERCEITWWLTVQKIKSIQRSKKIHKLTNLPGKSEGGSIRMVWPPSTYWLGISLIAGWDFSFNFRTTCKYRESAHRGFLESAHALWCTVFFVTTWIH